jgi:hypothetical protein
LKKDRDADLTACLDLSDAYTSAVKSIIDAALAVDWTSAPSEDVPLGNPASQHLLALH